MTTSELRLLVRQLGRSICGCGATSCDLINSDPGLCRALILLLGEGHPVSMDSLSAATGRPVDQLTLALRQSTSVAFDDDGLIVGAGLSLRPTVHRLSFDGRQLYAWCALDALMYPPLLGRVVQVESRCAASEERIRLVVRDNGVADLEPAAAVVSIVVPDPRRDVRSSFCDEVHFFRSPAAARSWLATRSHALLLSVQDAFNLGQHLTGAG